MDTQHTADNKTLDTATTRSQDSNSTSKSVKVLEAKYILPFILVGMLFPLWGFANDITNPLVNVFKDIFLISNAQSSMVQFAFYFGYGVMAIPAAIFIRKFSYKAGIVFGLALYATGATLFIPASIYMEFNYFLVALWVLTCGLALLETTANPYVLSMGHPDTATQRLNLAQAFNPIGSLTGMLVASNYILSELKVQEFRQLEKINNPEYADMPPNVVNGKVTEALSNFALTNPVEHQAMQAADLLTVRGPYIAIAAVVVVLLLVFLFAKLPKTISNDNPLSGNELKQTFKRLIFNGRYVEGVVAQMFYVGAQIMCWTFVIHYGISSVGITAAEAQQYNIAAMVIFLCSRFICTFLLGFIRPGNLLMLLAFGGGLLTLGTIFIGGVVGLYCLVAISACMSLMFPTIYGIALKDTGDDASLASAGLIMAIVGGAFMPIIQGALIDFGPIIGNIPSVQTSFLAPLICFMVICFYGYRAKHKYMV